MSGKFAKLEDGVRLLGYVRLLPVYGVKRGTGWATVISYGFQQYGIELRDGPMTFRAWPFAAAEAKFSGIRYRSLRQAAAAHGIYA